MIIYLHGFNSAASSSKATLVKEYCAKLGIKCAVPDLPHRPSEAIALAKHLCTQDDYVVAAGSSMGGFYTTWLVEKGHAQCGVVINPALKLSKKLADQVGTEQENYYTAAKYTFTKEHLAEVKKLEIAKIKDPKRYLLLAQKGDEVIDYQEAEKYYAGANHVIEEGGDHSFVGFARFLPDLAKLALAGVKSNPLS